LFTTADGILYALTHDGAFKWKHDLAGAADVPLAPSPVTNASGVITSSANGVILALNADADGSFHWVMDASTDPGDGFANSLAVGAPALTPTPTPGTPTPTPTGALTPTRTAVPFTFLTAVVAIRKSGS